MASDYATTEPGGRMPRAPVRRLGAWKLAYADFLTALCALFIVMWLVSDASPNERADLAEQFGAASSPQAVARADAPDPVAQLETNLQASALMAASSGHVSLHDQANGLRIELIDLDRSPLFETGEEQLNVRGERLIRLAAQAISPLGLPISIEGHTDSAPVSRPGYSNWELSAGRANAARRALVAGGVAPDRIAGVAGLADTRPLRPDAPYLPQNRRMSIVIHLEERP